MSFVPIDPLVLKDSIPIEVGDQPTTLFPQGIVTANLDTIWNQFADKGVIDPYLQYLFAKRKAIDYLMGTVWDEPDRAIGPFRLSMGQMATHLEAMQKDIDAEIAERNASQEYPLAATLVRTAPIEPMDMVWLVTSSSGMVWDANDPRITGNPYLVGPINTR